MRFVAVKGEAQGAGDAVPGRDLLVRQRTQAINALRGHLAEFGLVAPQGRAHVAGLAWPSTRRRRLFRRRCTSWARFCSSGSRPSMRRSPGWTGRSTSTRGEADDRGSGRSARWRSRPSRRRLRASAAGATSRPGSGWCRASTRPGASPGSAGYRRWASATSAAAGLRRHGAAALGHPAGRDPGPLAGPDAGAQAEDGRGGGAGQPDGAHRLGADREQAGLPGSRRLSGRRETGGCRDAGRTEDRVDETGSGKPVMCGVRSSTEVRVGPGPRISIQARGEPMPHPEAGHTEAPGRPQPAKENACINGGVHTRA